jgi:hypothetical protein
MRAFTSGGTDGQTLDAQVAKWRNDGEQRPASA